jgi:hypothetical protein
VGAKPTGRATNRSTNHQTTKPTNQELEALLRRELVVNNVFLWAGGRIMPREYVPQVGWVDPKP